MGPRALYTLLILTCLLGPHVRCEEPPEEEHKDHPPGTEPPEEEHKEHPPGTEPPEEEHKEHPPGTEPPEEEHKDNPPGTEPPEEKHKDHPPGTEPPEEKHKDHPPGAEPPEDEHKDHPPGPAHHHWSYTDISEWPADFPDCGGPAQSPINVDTQKTTFDPQLTPIALSGYDLAVGETLKLENNKHTVVLKLPNSLKIVGGLPHIYQAAQLHFHWGSESEPGSEHTVNGHRFPGEIHVVHYNTEYQSIDKAVKQPGGLAVLAAFLEEGPEDNAAYQHLLDHLEEVKDGGQSVEIPGFDIRGLLPQRLDRYFRYNGSLTTPPCFQSVNWTIFNQTIHLSTKQVAVLEDTIHYDHDHLLQMNFRDPQPLNGRLVLSSFRGPIGGRKGSGAAPQPSASTPGSDDSSSHDSGPGGHSKEDPPLGTGDMLAIIFAILFAFTAVSFYAYVKRNRKRNHRSSDSKSNVIYKAATAEENMA